ncbi:asparagine synthase (glutamine-hydrolyzing) [uncultured Aquincola sp.]|uniref:asparagine synthase (glutamine-hydrolyzing) n=1 Tax=uncultured Aquincola sp. TaxID=886556 RepID=UPI0032B19BDA
MCGIAGWYARGGRAVPAQVTRAQCDTIVHRGPDDQGQFIDGDLGMGMRRLSVVDVDGGHQPMTSADGRCVIVFNGEVYNFAALRTELQARGHRFRTRSDTEVVLEAFAAWGEAAWPRLEGMFAVAVWDRRARSLHLARDPLGIKPLYWTAQQGGLAFGSELKALGPVPGLQFEVDVQAVEQVVTLGAVLAPATIYRGVHKLPPGTALTLQAQGEPVLRRFWSLRLQPAEGPVDEAAWIEDCQARLLDTVRQHLVADVPLGAFLSGGVDSSAIVAAMSRLRREPVRTFTIGFAQAGFDESPVAAQVAAHLGCKHLSRELSPEAAMASLEALAQVYDEPFADDSAMPTWLVSRLAREQVTVALSGDGGDELFAGYRRHRGEAQLARLKRLPGASRVLQGLAHLPPLPGAAGARLARVARAAALADPAERNLLKQYRAPEAVLQRLWGAGLRPPQVAGYRRWAAELLGDAPRGDPLLAMLHADTTVWLPDDMLTKVDRASMAHSLEVRVPLLSHRFVDWAATVPTSLKLRGGVGKHLLRKAVEGWLPPGILSRPKQGFAVPVGQWLMGPFGDHVQAVWHDAGVEDSGFFTPGALDRLLARHRSGAADHAALLYTLLMFAHWWPRRLGRDQRTRSTFRSRTYTQLSPGIAGSR